MSVTFGRDAGKDQGDQGVPVWVHGRGHLRKLGSRTTEMRFTPEHPLSLNLCSVFLLFFFSVVVVVIFCLFSFASVVAGCLSALTLMKSVAALVGKSTLLCSALVCVPFTRPSPACSSLPNPSRAHHHAVSHVCGWVCVAVFGLCHFVWADEKVSPQFVALH